MKNHERIMETVADAYKVTVADIRGPSRLRAIVEARRMLILLLKGEDKHAVGRLINRSRSVVRHHLTNALEELGRDWDLSRMYEKLKSEINSDMKLKLTTTQLRELYEVIEAYLADGAGNPADELIHLHLDDIGERIRRRIKGGKDNLTLDEKQTKAFVLWYMHHGQKASYYGSACMVYVINQIKPISQSNTN